MRKGNNLFFQKKTKQLDLTDRTPQIRVSICTGEETGGYFDHKSGRFVEVMKLAQPSDYEEFFRLCGTKEIERVY
ncbi:MAG: hypothetical protein J6D38_07785 [Solobacterium sp.]|nr:hypothetical protein [Solobacterium sp.]MBR3346044.1 hypothetical protein [Solobacterium sp.]